VPPLRFPGFHTNKLAPLTVSTVELPEQILAFVRLNVGVVTTVSVIVLNWLGHIPLKPVMLYTVVAGGLRF
jgi:hypothetical protein